MQDFFAVQSAAMVNARYAKSPMHVDPDITDVQGRAKAKTSVNPQKSKIKSAKCALLISGRLYRQRVTIDVVLTVIFCCNVAIMSSIRNQPFVDHCCHMATTIKHPVPDRVKPSFDAQSTGCQKLQMAV